MNVVDALKARSALVVIVVVLASCAFTDNRQVPMRPEHLACRVDDDCTRIPLSCSSCGEPVAAAHAEALTRDLDKLCSRYRGPVVDCPPPSEVICNAGQCAVAPYPWEMHE